MIMLYNLLIIYNISMFILTQLIFPSSKSTIELLEEGGNMFKSNNNNFIVNLEHISHLFLVFQLLTLNK